jgi:hypothetical protein
MASEASVTKHSDSDPDSSCQSQLTSYLVLSFESRPVRGIRRNRYLVPDWVRQQVYLNSYRKELVLRDHVQEEGSVDAAAWGMQ